MSAYSALQAKGGLFTAGGVKRRCSQRVVGQGRACRQALLQGARREAAAAACDRLGRAPPLRRAHLLKGSPRFSPFLPVSARVSARICPRIGPYLPVSPRISPYLPLSPRISPPSQRFGGSSGLTDAQRCSAAPRRSPPTSRTFSASRSARRSSRGTGCERRLFTPAAVDRRAVHRGVRAVSGVSSHLQLWTGAQFIEGYGL